MSEAKQTQQLRELLTKVAQGLAECRKILRGEQTNE